MAQIKQRLKDLAEDVIDGRVPRADAAVVGQIYNIVLRTLEIERKVCEQEELSERLEALERSKRLWEGSQ